MLGGPVVRELQQMSKDNGDLDYSVTQISDIF